MDFPSEFLRGKLGRKTNVMSIFRSIDVKSLKLSGVTFNVLSDVVLLPIEELDIRNTQVVDLAPLRNLRSLKKITISSGQFN